MVEYEKVLSHEESERAPPGICELSIQAYTSNAFDYAPELQNRLKQYVEEGIEVNAFEFDDRSQSDRIVIYTGTDRLDIATLRDIAEVYGQSTGYPNGNIPSNMNIIPITERDTDATLFAWFEFKLEEEMPEEEVKWLYNERVHDSEVVGQNPVGEHGESILFRNGNVAHERVREVINNTTKVRDNFPVDQVRVVCEVSKY